jgi:hypothetical protein
MESIQFKVEYKENVPQIESPEVVSTPYLKISEDQFYINILGIAEFYVEKGERVIVHPQEGSDKASIDLFLNGSVLGAILHQKGILPFHGSSFSYKGRSIVICGERGAGKSSITAAFCQNEATFICDDITPIKLSNDDVQIIPIKSTIKLWENALDQLNIPTEGLSNIRPNIEKYYCNISPSITTNCNLNLVIVLTTHNKDIFENKDLTGIEKFKMMSSHIYRKAYLKGMPSAKQNHYQLLLKICNNIKVVQVTRPKEAGINDTLKYITNLLASF